MLLLLLTSACGRLQAGVQLGRVQDDHLTGRLAFAQAGGHTRDRMTQVLVVAPRWNVVEDAWLRQAAAETCFVGELGIQIAAG